MWVMVPPQIVNFSVIEERTARFLLGKQEL